MQEITVLYPPIEPYWSGYLPVSDLHALYVETAGNPAGIPVVFLHGGPGDGARPGARRYFDPDRYRIIVFDQRGCGRSTPLAELADNTTADLVADLERIRAFLGVEAWVLFGGSWGSTLALAYAQAHPDRALGLVLWGIFLGSAPESTWLYGGGAGALFPQAYEQFASLVPQAERGDLVGAYLRRLGDSRESVRRAASDALARWEMTVLRLPPMGPMAPFVEPTFIQGAFWPDPPAVSPSALLGMHYQAHGCFLSPGQLLAGVEAIRHIPTTILSGSEDLMCPPSSAWALHLAWPQATFYQVTAAGHTSGPLTMAERLIEATDELAAALAVRP